LDILLYKYSPKTHLIYVVSDKLKIGATLFSEKNIPRLIILTPIITVILIAFFTIYFFVKTQNNYFKEESFRLEEQYIIKQKDILKKEIEYVINYMNHYVKNNPRESLEVLKNELLRYIESIRFEDHGYIWIHDTNYYLKAHPFRQDSIGKYDIELKDAVGTLITKEFIDKTVQNPEGIFIEYYWQKPKTVYASNKLGFFKLYEKFNWVIGSGLYIDDIEKSIHQNKILLEQRIDKYVRLIVLVSCIVIFVIGILSVVMSNKINKVFNSYKKSVQKKELLLEDMNTNLELKVEQAIKEVKKKDRAMLHQSRLARMGTMLSMIAHQWRQPLSKISALLMELETATKFKKSDDKMIMATVADSTKLLHYMSDTIEDFRNFFKPDKKKVDFYINDACNEALSLVEASVENFGIILNIKMEENPKINGFEREFAQVILNLLSNAKDVLKQREIKKPTIYLSVVEKNRHVIITVEDNGGGVEEELLDLIFEPYFTTKERLKGTGLGLYMSKMIIEKNMGGELSVENINDGAQFKITLEV